MSTGTLALYGGIVILTGVYYFLRRNSLKKPQKWMIGILWIFSVMGFVWMTRIFESPRMPTSYLNEFITPTVKQWLGQ